MTFLQKLNSHVHVYHPCNAVEDSESKPPSLILLFGWMDALIQHELKFIDALRELYPTATILFIRSTSGYWVSSQRNLENLLQPAVDILFSRPWDSILVQVLSNGGGFIFTALHKALTKQAQLRPDMIGRGPRVALILDSTPGDHAIQSVLDFAGPTNPVLYTLSAPIFATLYAVWALLNALGGNASLFTAYRSSLLAPSLLPAVTSPTDPPAPRLYIYSVKDRVVRFRNVERHIQQAEGMGLDVSVEKFEKTPHMGHMRSDAQRYWGAVKDTWVRAKL